MPDQHKKDAENGEGRLPTVGTGNASNPSPRTEEGPQPNQLIDPKGEKYLREVSSPEDYPDAQDEQEAEK